jgi:hypothetical protein
MIAIMGSSDTIAFLSEAPFKSPLGHQVGRMRRE